MLFATWAPPVSDEITAISTAVLALGVIVAIIQFRHLRRSRHVDTFLEFTRRRDAAESTKARQLVGPKINEALLAFFIEEEEKRSESFYACLLELDFWEGLGNLYKFKAVSLKMIESEMGTTVTREWDRWLATVSWMRRKYGGTIYDNFGNLARNLRERKLGRFKRWRLKLSRRVAGRAKD